MGKRILFKKTKKTPLFARPIPTDKKQKLKENLKAFRAEQKAKKPKQGMNIGVFETEREAKRLRLSKRIRKKSK